MRYEYRPSCDNFVADGDVMDYRQQLTRLAELYGAKRKLSEASIANQIRCNGGFFARLRAGGSCRVDTMHRVIQFFSDRWPPDLAWPDEIDRPTSNGEPA